MYLLPKYLPMFLAFYGDSTMTNESAMVRPSSPLGFKVKFTWREAKLRDQPMLECKLNPEAV